MSARGCERIVRGSALTAFGALFCVQLAAAQTPAAQAPPPAVKQARPGAGPAPPAQSADGRYGIVVLAATLDVHAEPSSKSAVIVKLQQGVRLQADQRRGAWYRVRLPDGQTGWIGRASCRERV